MHYGISLVPNTHIQKTWAWVSAEPILIVIWGKNFVSETEIGKSEFSYEKIAQIAETKQYYVFVFSENHAQIYDKSTMSGGTTEEFEHFLCNMTKKAVVKVS